MAIIFLLNRVRAETKAVYIQVSHYFQGVIIE